MNFQKTRIAQALSQTPRGQAGLSLVEILLGLAVATGVAVLGINGAAKRMEATKADEAAQTLKFVAKGVAGFSSVALNFGALANPRAVLSPDLFDGQGMKPSAWGSVDVHPNSGASVHSSYSVVFEGVRAYGCARLVNQNYDAYARVNINGVNAWTRGQPEPDPSAIVEACSSAENRVEFESLTLFGTVAATPTPLPPTTPTPTPPAPTPTPTPTPLPPTPIEPPVPPIPAVPTPAVPTPTPPTPTPTPPPVPTPTPTPTAPTPTPAVPTPTPPAPTPTPPTPTPTPTPPTPIPPAPTPTPTAAEALGPMHNYSYNTGWANYNAGLIANNPNIVSLVTANGCKSPYSALNITSKLEKASMGETSTMTYTWSCGAFQGRALISICGGKANGTGPINACN